MYKLLRQIRSCFAVFSALFITVITSKVRGNQNCGRDELMKCSKPLSVLTDSGLTFVSNKDDLERLCPDLKQAMRCIHNYTRHCMTMKERHHFRELFHGTTSVAHQLCKNTTYQTEYLKHAPCMKRTEHENEICLNRYLRAMEKIELTNLMNDTDLIYQKRKREVGDGGIGGVCCAFQEYIGCTMRTMGRTCGEEAAVFSGDFLGKMSSRLIKMHCSGYGRSECGLYSYQDSTFKINSILLTILTTIIFYLR